LTNIFLWNIMFNKRVIMRFMNNIIGKKHDLQNSSKIFYTKL